MAQNGKFINIITKLANFPRWHDYAPRFEDDTCSHSARVAIYSLICSLLEQNMFSHPVDILKTVCRAIFHDINESKTGPIKHKTKKEAEVAEHIRNLEKEAAEEIVSYLSRSLQPIFYDYIVNAEDDTLEGRIVDAMDTFDAVMFCKRENGSAAIFEDTYTQLLNKLKTHPLASVRYMAQSVEEENAFYQFLHAVLMLDRIKRWSGKHNTIPDQDLMHIGRASALVVFNCYVEKVKYADELSRKGIDYDILSVVAKTLCHDIPEAMTGDVLGPIKNSKPEMKQAFERYEKTAAFKMAQLLPECIRDDVYEYMANAKSNDYEGQMVDIADKLDALIKTNMERRNNRFEYEMDYRRQLRKVQSSFDNPCVIFFLAYILHDLDYPIFEDMHRLWDQ